jgi:hypothetical protein
VRSEGWLSFCPLQQRDDVLFSESIITDRAMLVVVAKSTESSEASLTATCKYDEQAQADNRASPPKPYTFASLAYLLQQTALTVFVGWILTLRASEAARLLSLEQSS